MTTQSQLEFVISKAKSKAMDLATNYINLSKNGEDIGCKSLKLVVITSQIQALEDFYCQYFNENGNITPTFTCVPDTLVKQFVNNIFPPDDQFEINIIDGGNA